jgi:diacylglycerol O-acyltransferase / wax synthase
VSPFPNVLPKIDALRPLDAGWLWIESSSNLMHGGVLCIFDPPEGAGPEFVRGLVAHMRTQTTEGVAPWNRRLKLSGLGRLWPQWETVDHIDPDRHIFHLALPAPGDERELGVLISRLQSTALDKNYPLWSVHVIEGLADGRFAVFGKMHHALADGVAALGMVDTWLSNDPEARNQPAIWAAVRPRRTRPATPASADRGNGPPPAAPADAAAESPAPLLQTIADLVSPPKFLTAGARAVYKAATGVSARPYSAPRSAINTPITAHRRVATQSYDLDRFRSIARQTGGTINDVVLAVCAGGLRRYLTEIDALPSQPLITNIPVSVRRDDGKPQGGNAISWAMLSLATDVEDVRERFAAIRSSTKHAKQQLNELRADAIDTYTLLAVTPILVEQLAKLGGHVPPMYNIPISNVPGPRQLKYLDGAVLREVQALTVLYGGHALNTVAVSYANRLNFSFTACDAALPHVQRLATYCGDALAELEQAYPHSEPEAEPKPSPKRTATTVRKKQ